MNGIKLNAGDRFDTIDGKSVIRRADGTIDEIEWVEYPSTVGESQVSKDGGKTWSDWEPF